MAAEDRMETALQIFCYDVRARAARQEKNVDFTLPLHSWLLPAASVPRHEAAAQQKRSAPPAILPRDAGRARALQGGLFCGGAGRGPGKILADGAPAPPSPPLPAPSSLCRLSASCCAKLSAKGASWGSGSCSPAPPLLPAPPPPPSRLHVRPRPRLQFFSSHPLSRMPSKSPPPINVGGGGGTRYYEQGPPRCHPRVTRVSPLA